MTPELWIAILGTAIPIILPPLIGLVIFVVQRASQGLPIQKRELLAQVTRTVVPAVEQLTTAELNGPGKKQEAMKLAALTLQHLGVKNVDPMVLGAYIEEAVYSLKQGQQGATVVTQQSPMSSQSNMPL